MAQYPNPASQLNGGVPPQSYGACPRPPSPASSEFPELLLDFASYGPPRTQKPKGPRRGLLWYWLVIVLLQVVLIVYHSNLAKFVSLESTANRAAREGSALLAEREKSEQERAQMRHDREVWGEVPDDRVLPGAYWKDIWPSYNCRAYGKREYWGVLPSISEGWSAMDAYMNTPAEAKGVTIRQPDRCAFINGSPTIHGYWMVDWDQEDCKPWHKDIRNTDSAYMSQGCTNRGSGLTRIEGKVEGIINRKEQDWWVMCESTPFTWDSIKYTSPVRCEERSFGTKVAMWDVPAESCR